MTDDEKAVVLRNVAAQVAELAGSLGGRAIVAGASQGGDLAAVLALHNSDAVRIGLAVAASVPRPLLTSTTKSAAPIHFFHGVDDQVVPIALARDTFAVLEDTVAAVKLAEYPGVGHAVPDEMRNDLHRTIQGCI